MRTAVHAISKLLSVVAGVAIVYIMVITVSDVFRRHLLDGRSIPAAIEYVEVLLAAIAYLSLSFAQREGGHIAVGLVTDRLPVRVAAALRGAATVFGTAILVWMTIATTQLAINSARSGEYRQGLLNVPIWPVRILIPVGLTLLVIQFLINLYDEVQAIRTGEQPPHKQRAEIPAEL